jgi:acetyltransferase-like isoleucine patch superfamily enzyme
MSLVDDLRRLYAALQNEKLTKYERRVPFGDLIVDRWQIAGEYGFGEGTSCYDSVLILGDVTVGQNCWIGPNVVLDGSGGLKIGDHVDIIAGPHIYSHNTVDRTLSAGKDPVDYATTEIGSRVYIGPNSVIQMGVSIGDDVVIGALSFVNSDIPSGSKAWGVPARLSAEGPGS